MIPSRALLAAPIAMLALLSGCSQGQGTGVVTSDALFVHECWGTLAGADGGVKGDAYDLQPDFFAAIPFRSTVLLRIQRGNDIEEVSDGLLVLVDDIAKVRAAIQGAGPADAGATDAGATDAGATDGGLPDGGLPDGGAGNASLCKIPSADGGLSEPAPGKTTFQVALPAGVVPPGSPSVPPADLLADPPIVHMSLFLHRSCHNQNTVLNAVSGTITFSSLFSGDPNESQASEKLTEASFDVQVGDLADVPLGHFARDIPCELQSNVHGNFRFYFERGQPGQPFP